MNRWWLMFVYLFLLACAQRETLPVMAPGDTLLVVNSSNDVARYHQAQMAFTEMLSSQRIRVVNLEYDRAPVDTLQDLINQHRFDVIYCIGAKALGSVEQVSPDVPVVFSSVLNWHYFAKRRGYYGIASDTLPGTQLAMFKLFFPELKRLGIMYSKTNAGFIEQARVEAHALGFELVAVPVRSSRNVIELTEAVLADVQGLWLIPDPEVISSSLHAEDIFQVADRMKRPVFASNRIFADLGATLTISADQPTIGRQAALVAERLMMPQGGGAPEQVVSPAGSHVTLNMQKVAEYGISLNVEAMDTINELIE